MPAPAWEDLGDFFDTEEFAFAAVISLAGGGVVSLAGNFDDPYVDAELADYDHDTVNPKFTCPEHLVGGVRRGDTIAITFPAGVQTFDILTSPQPDGTGIAVLELALP